MNEDPNVDLNDERLCAFLDDQLDPAQRAQVEAALAADAGARLRLERLRGADQQLHKALPLRGKDHFEAAMVARIRGGAPVVTRSWQRSVLPWAAAAAVVGVFAGYLLPRQLPASGAMQVAASSAPAQLSGDVAGFLQVARAGEVTDARGLSVVLSFESADARYCRVFHSAAGATAGEGLACQSAAGWQLVAWDGLAGGPTEGFRAAGASGLIDGAMDALGGKPAMSSEEEAALIERGWK